jgi:23S rRNA (cytidine1920-2'-O)/16S rRNA (cytidine1409-2'-O)-methyltransferase
MIAVLVSDLAMLKRAASAPEEMVTVADSETRIVAAVADVAFSLGLGCLGVVASPLPGPSGNVEYFLWLNKAGKALLEVDLDLAIEKGPA